MPCMVCHENSPERKWACTWCYLRVCIRCSEELVRTPGRDVKSVLEKRGRNAEDVEQQRYGEREARGSNGSVGRVGFSRLGVWEERREEVDFT